MSVGLTADILRDAVEELEAKLGEGNALGESRVSVRAADLKLLLDAYDDRMLELLNQRSEADR